MHIYSFTCFSVIILREWLMFLINTSLFTLFLVNDVTDLSTFVSLKRSYMVCGIKMLHIGPLGSFLQSHSLWIPGHRCTSQSHCHSQPHYGSCRSVGKLPRRIQENMFHYSRVPTSLACRHTLQTWGDSWETRMKGESHSRVNMTPKAHANGALAMSNAGVGDSMHSNLNFIPRLAMI